MRVATPKLEAVDRAIDATSDAHLPEATRFLWALYSILEHGHIDLEKPTLTISDAWFADEAKRRGYVLPPHPEA